MAKITAKEAPFMAKKYATPLEYHFSKDFAFSRYILLLNISSQSFRPNMIMHLAMQQSLTEKRVARPAQRTSPY